MNRIKILLIFLAFTNSSFLFCISGKCAEEKKVKATKELKKKRLEENKLELEKMKNKLQKLSAERKELRKNILTQERILGEVPEELNVQLWELINTINDVKGNIFRLDQIVNKGF